MAHAWGGWCLRVQFCHRLEAMRAEQRYQLKYAVLRLWKGVVRHRKDTRNKFWICRKARRLHLARKALDSWKLATDEAGREECRKTEDAARLFAKSCLHRAWLAWQAVVERACVQREALSRVLQCVAVAENETACRRVLLAWREGVGSNERLAMVWAARQSKNRERGLDECFNEWASLARMLHLDTSQAVQSTIAELQQASPISVGFRAATPARRISNAYSPSLSPRGRQSDSRAGRSLGGTTLFLTA
eukprot:scaffold21_cov368-Prasinococcus_capsulatus_cf.AAC.21